MNFVCFFICVTWVFPAKPGATPNPVPGDTQFVRRSSCPCSPFPFTPSPPPRVVRTAQVYTLAPFEPLFRYWWPLRFFFRLKCLDTRGFFHSPPQRFLHTHRSIIVQPGFCLACATPIGSSHVIYFLFVRDADPPLKVQNYFILQRHFRTSSSTPFDLPMSVRQQIPRPESGAMTECFLSFRTPLCFD